MDPIINPWLIYLFEISNDVEISATIVAVIIGCSLVICTVGYFMHVGSTYDPDKRLANHCWRWIKYQSIAFSIFLFVAILVPSRTNN